MKYVIHTDGGARGNPGPAAAGVVIEKTDGVIKKTVAAFGTYIGEATNNVAEYSAVVEALEYLKTHGLGNKGNDTVYDFYLDSVLVVNQLNGLFKVKDASLRNFLSKIRILEQEVGGVVMYQYVPRAQNSKADFQVNHALDNR